MQAAPGPGFFALVGRPDVVKRALGYAVVVGAILIVINHGDAIARGELTSASWWKMALTVLVPYSVSTLSSVSALRDARRAREAESRS